jgi:uncharacterized membrane protein YfcA
MESFPIVIQYLLVFCAGLVAAVINVMAGGGSALSVGVLTLLGMPVNIANGTNRVGVLTSGISSVKKFHEKGKLDIKGALPFAFIALVGSVIGAYIASILSSTIFKRYLGIAMIFVVITLFIPQKNSDNKSPNSAAKKLISYPLMLIIGFYGGFIQAGVGFLIMALYRHLNNLNLVTINGRKMFITTIFTIPAILIFALKGQINWGYAVVLAMGNYVGGTMATIWAIEKGEKVVKIILTVAIILMAIKLFWIT